MKYRLVELLRCIKCHADFDVFASETRLVPNDSGEVFQCQRYCSLDRTSVIPVPARCSECIRTDIVTGNLTCRKCGEQFPVVQSVPWLFEKATGSLGDVLSDTIRVYSHVWTTLTSASGIGPAHVDKVQDALAESVVYGKIGLDAGSGCGSDTAAMARHNPSVEVISLDLSEGVYATRQRTEGLPNVHIVRGSVLSLPLKSGVCDFGYSFGVLHHTPDPLRGLREIVRVLKAGGRVSLYLYEDHANNLWKALPLSVIAAFRQLTTRLNTWALSGLCYLLSPFVIMAFSIPARVMRRFRPTRALAEQMPFNFGTTLFSVHADLIDRLGAPIEVRYSREELTTLLQQSCLIDIRITKMRALAGWVARAIKPALL